MADFYDPEFMKKFLMEMDQDERREAVDDWLFQVVEPWQGDSADDKLARSLVGAMTSLSEAAFTADLKDANPFVLGIWMDAYQKISRSFQTLDGIARVKKSFDKEKRDDSD